MRTVKLLGFAAPRGTDLEDGNMKLMMMVAVTAAALGFAGVAVAQDQSALGKSSGCLNCHDVDAKKVGPSFKSVAAKYKGKADAEAMLVTKVSTAKDHPKVSASPDDVKALVKWVLAM
jgi:cytochrome c